MSKKFHEELKQVENDLIKMGSVVEKNIYDCIISLKNTDIELANKVIDSDDRIDDFELDLKERCSQLIALHQPVAKDLRTILVASEMVTSLERMGDHTCNIAYMVKRIGKEELLKPLIDIPRMSQITGSRLNSSLDAFINRDIKMAKQIAREDEKIDKLDEQIMRELLTYMMEDSGTIKQANSLLFISRFLERMGDQTTNICEGIIYLVSGERQNY